MKNYFRLLSFVAFVSLITLVSCGDDTTKEGDLQINFKLQYDGQPLEMFKNYTYPVTGEKVLFSRISFFVADLVAKSTAGDKSLNDIDYLDLSAAHEDATKAKNGYSYVIKNLAPASYSGLEFSIGVPTAKNNLLPKDFPSTSVLSSNAEYWTAWKSYIFFRPEGKIALNNTAEPNDLFALHIGGNEMLLDIALAKQFAITSGNITQIDVIIDMAKFFNGTQKYNMSDGLQLHSLTQKQLMKILKDNLATAVK